MVEECTHIRMRNAVLSQLYRDFELRCIEFVRDIHMQAADVSDEEDALNAQFNAVMVASTRLLTEIHTFEKQETSRNISPRCRADLIWSACVAHVCSNQIIQQIGGPEGQRLPDLKVTQLLDLVAWVEIFRETIEETFPSIGSIHAKKTYFDEKPLLFTGDEKETDIENATDILAWANNMMWEVHRLAQDEFLLRTRSQTHDLLTKAYSAHHETYQTSDMRLVTSLCEDVFSIIRIHLQTIRASLSQNSDALVMAVSLIFSQLRLKQIKCRDVFLKDFESCCAAANDFERMSEQCEEIVKDLESDFSNSSKMMLQESCNTLVSLYSGDAVYAAQKTYWYIFQPVHSQLADDFFSTKWETDLTHNELALRLTKTLDDFVADLKMFLDDFMLRKAVDAIVRASVLFYIKCLLQKAERHNSNSVSFFSDSLLALERMSKDVELIRNYFDEMAENMPALSKVIEREFQVLTTLQELMRIATDISDADASDFIIVLHKQVKDINITKFVMGDLWHLVQPTEERIVRQLTESMEESLITICVHDDSKPIKNDRMDIPGLCLDKTLATFYSQSRRKRPVKLKIGNWQPKRDNRSTTSKLH